MSRQNPPYFQGDHDDADGPDLPFDPGNATCEIDNELQAAIEYKIATSGAAGVATVLQLLNEAVRRHV